MSHKQHNICQRNGEMMSATKINTRHGKNTVGISIYMIIDCIQIISPLLRTHFQVTFLCQLFDTEYLRWLRILLFMTLHSDVLRSGQRRQRVQWSAGRLQRAERDTGQYLSVCHKKLLVWIIIRVKNIKWRKHPEWCSVIEVLEVSDTADSERHSTGSGQYLSVCHKKLLVWGLLLEQRTKSGAI